MDKVKMLAVDFGSSGGKAFVGILESEKLTIVEVHRFSNDSVVVNGNVYWDVLRLFHEIKIAFQKAYKLGHNDIITVAVDTWGVDFGLIDEYGNLIDNPRHYRDLLKKDSVQEVLELINPKEIYSATGTSIRWTNTLMQLHSLNKHCPSQVKNAQTFLMLPSLLSYFLCGIKKIDYSIASTSQMLNIHSLEWDKGILSKLQLPHDIIAALVKPGTVLGPLRGNIAEDFGVSKHHQVVAVAGHDTECAVAAIPATDTDYIFISCGTWALLGVELEKPILSEYSASLDFINEQGVNGNILFQKIINGLWLVQECKREWENDGCCIEYNDLENEAGKVKSLESIINPSWREFEERGNILQKIKNYCKRTNQKVPTYKAEVYVCALQSLALEFRMKIDQIQEILGKEYSRINIVGGGAQSEILCQFIADATGKKVIAGPFEATAMGNILIQGMAIGEIDGYDELKQIAIQSCKTKEYVPVKNTVWDIAYIKYLDLIEMDNCK